MEPAARAIGMQIQFLNASTSREATRRSRRITLEPTRRLVRRPRSLFKWPAGPLTAMAACHALPATYSLRDFAEAGGLTSYGPNMANAFRQIGLYAGRILKGAKPGDLPVMQSTKSSW